MRSSSPPPLSPGPFRLGSRARSSPSLSTPSPSSPTLRDPLLHSSPLAPQELIAATKLVAAFRRMKIRKAWKRLIAYALTRVRVNQRVEQMRARIVQHESALVIWRAWKRSRSFSGLVFRVVHEKKLQDHIETITRTFCVDTAEVTGEIHVDYRDFSAAQEALSQFVPLQVSPEDLETSLREILGFDPLTDDALRLSSHDASMESPLCPSCCAEHAGGNNCETCQRSFCVDCTIPTRTGCICFLCHSSRMLSESQFEETEQQVQGARPILSSPLSQSIAGNLPAIDACTLDAALIFILTPSYPYRDSLLHTLLSVMGEWAPTHGDRLAFVRGLHLHYLRGNTLAVEDVLREWILMERSLVFEELRAYVSLRKTLVSNSKADVLFFNAVENLLVKCRHDHRTCRIDNELLTNAFFPRSLPIPVREITHALQLPSLELARQMTLVDSSLYSCILPSELLNTAWAGKHKARKALNLLVLTNRFNDVANWVSHLILLGESPKERCATISFFIDVQHHFLHLNNLHGVMALHAALCGSSVARLSQSWSLVNPLKLTHFAAADKLVSPQLNYKLYRKHLAEHMRGPCVPYIGVDLTALTMLAEQHTHIENRLPSLPCLLNISKMEKITTILDAMKEFQSNPYPFPLDDSMQDFLQTDPLLLKARGMSAQQFYEISLLREPRKAETPAPSRRFKLFGNERLSSRKLL